MHKTTFFPVGNADCMRIDLECGKKILFDYAHYRNAEDDSDLRIDLASALRDDLLAAGRDSYDIVAFTHADDDHLHGFSDFFHLDHAKKYQTEGRIKIDVMWVPAAVIIDTELIDEPKVLQEEARHRLRVGRGIRVFSRPDALKEWLEQQGIKPDDRKNLFTDAGQLAPEFNMTGDAVEFFVHSPFAVRQEDGSLIDKNGNSLVMQATFAAGGKETRLILGSDCDWEGWADIANITKFHERNERLAWDIFKISHHCSYKSLSADKGKEKTIPVNEVKWLFEQGAAKGTLVATCDPIPTNDDNDQPPHRQTAKFYEDVAAKIGGEFKVTMEHPNKSLPKPLEIKIDGFGATIRKITSGGGAVAVGQSAPRAG
jgi:hypothetical protein